MMRKLEIRGSGFSAPVHKSQRHKWQLALIAAALAIAATAVAIGLSL